MNLCSKCYRDLCLKDHQQASIKSTVEASLSSASSSSLFSPSLNSSTEAAIEPFSPPIMAAPALNLPDTSAAEVSVAVAQPNRCLVCRKRVGLTGFKCRCGTTFCGLHRYPEKHACTFDFKKVGREEIARANPLVKAEKLEKI